MSQQIESLKWTEITFLKKIHLKKLELKSMITEMKKNILQGFHSRFKVVEERISEPEVTAVEITQYEEQKEKI